VIFNVVLLIFSFNAVKKDTEVVYNYLKNKLSEMIKCMTLDFNKVHDVKHKVIILKNKQKQALLT
jgi:hypothetical protein